MVQPKKEFKKVNSNRSNIINTLGIIQHLFGPIPPIRAQSTFINSDFDPPLINWFDGLSVRAPILIIFPLCAWKFHR